MVDSCDFPLPQRTSFPSTDTGIDNRLRSMQPTDRRGMLTDAETSSRHAVSPSRGRRATHPSLRSTKSGRPHNSALFAGARRPSSSVPLLSFRFVRPRADDPSILSTLALISCPLSTCISITHALVDLYLTLGNPGLDVSPSTHEDSELKSRANRHFGKQPSRDAARHRPRRRGGAPLEAGQGSASRSGTRCYGRERCAREAGPLAFCRVRGRTAVWLDETHRGTSL